LPDCERPPRRPHGSRKVRRRLNQRGIYGDQGQVRQAPVRAGGGQIGRERDAAPQEGHAQEREGRQRRHGDEPQAGHRDRAVGGAEERRQGAEPAEAGERVRAEAVGRDVEVHGPIPLDCGVAYRHAGEVGLAVEDRLEVRAPVDLQIAVDVPDPVELEVPLQEIAAGG
jgi:hypothetical protein